MSVIDPGPTPDPVVEPPAAVVTPPPASPWAADAAAYFGDNPEAIAGFDRYMREKQQPYVTQLEESTKDARELWDDLQTDSGTAARDIIASVYREHPDVIAAYDAIFAEPTPVVEPTPPEDVPEWAKPIIEDRQARLDREASEAQAAAYSTFKDGLKASHDLNDDDIGLIDPFIYQSPDNPDVAVAAYKAWRAKGLGAAATPDPVPTPPPVLGDGATTAATPPLATKYEKYGDMGPAIQDFLARHTASATPPPVVG